MATAVHSLWPSEIRPGVLSPFAILKMQAEALGTITNHILLGEVKVANDVDGKETSVSLDIVVPALENRRHRILTARHHPNLIYPAQIDADCFRPNRLTEGIT